MTSAHAHAPHIWDAKCAACPDWVKFDFKPAQPGEIQQYHNGLIGPRGVPDNVMFKDHAAYQRWQLDDAYSKTGRTRFIWLDEVKWTCRQRTNRLVRQICDGFVRALRLW